MATLVQIKKGGNGIAWSVTAGDGMVIVAICAGLAADHVTSVTDTQGNTWTQAPGAAANTGHPSLGGLYTDIWYCAAAAESGACNITIHVTSVGGVNTSFAYELQGTIAFDDADGLNGTGSNATPAVFSTPTITATDALFVMCAAQHNVFTTPTLSAGWTLETFTLADDGPVGHQVNTGSISATVTYPANWNNTTDRDYVASIAAFTAAVTPTTGNIIIEKVTDPHGSPQSFNFTSDYGPSFSLTDGESNDSGPLDPGIYSVSEAPVDLWSTETSQDPSAIVVGAGDTVTVTFTNTATHGKIVVVKATNPSGSPQSFSFSNSFGPTFNLLGGQSRDSGPLDPGTYSVAEAPVSGWTTSVSQDPSVTDVTAGLVTTVTFTNTQQAPPPFCGKQTLIGGRFQSWDGHILANGFLRFELSEDSQELCTGGQIVAGLAFRLRLDNLGSIAGRPQIWSNDNLDPVNTYYVVNAFKHDGTPAWRVPQFWVLPSLPDPYDVGNIVPTMPANECCPPLTPGGIVLLLQTNGVNNGSQTKLNLVQGTGMSITQDGAGNVTFVSTGGGGGGGSAYTVVAASTTGSVAYQATPFVVELDTTGASDITRTLPTAAGNAGAVFVLKKVDSGIGIVTIAGFGGQTLDGASTFLLTNQNQFVSFVSDGSVWWSIALN